MIRALAALALLLPGQALACACCAEPGERSTITHAIQHAGDVGAAMARAGQAHLFTTACGYECVEGIVDPDDLYDLKVDNAAGDVVISLTGASGTGELHLALPATFTQFKVDLEPEIAPMTALYVERRFTVGVTGHGAFKTDWPLVGELVLSGFGNHCQDALESTHWTLGVDQVGARYRLFGRFPD